MKFYILIIFKKSYLNFSLSYWLVISLQDLSWLAFTYTYAGIVKTWEIV